MLLPYQKIDLKIYERIKSLGPVGLTVSLADFSQQIGQDQPTTVERLDGLATHKRIGLFKYVGGSRLPSGGFDKNTFFHRDSFIIELTPQVLGDGSTSQVKMTGDLAHRPMLGPVQAMNRVDLLPGQHDSAATV